MDVLRLAGRPSLNVVVFGLENELPLLAVEDVFDHLRAVDGPEIADLLALELPDFHIQSSPGPASWPHPALRCSCCSSNPKSALGLSAILNLHPAAPTGNHGED